MSSIYRKGRDGYFYYQIYVLNEKTGKKDKKIFHSLSTKNEKRAKEKQIFYDKKYEKKIKSNKGKFLFLKKNSSAKNLGILFMVVVIFFSLYSYFSFPFAFENIKNDSLKFGYESDLSKSLEVEMVNQDTSKKKIVNQKLNSREEIKADVDSIIKPKPNEILVYPAYEIRRVDEISGSFKQGKIYATIEGLYDKEILLSLCQRIKLDYTQYSNIIICLYDNSKVGRNIALGVDKPYSSQEQSKAWLVMYSYNSVEGDYFDNNPSSYLSGYKN